MCSRAERRELQEQQRQAKALQRLTDQACEIVLVRHGETQWNVEQRLQGQLAPGPGLTERGRQQAAVLAARLRSERFDCIYSSDLMRTIETALVVAAARQCASQPCSGNQSCEGHTSNGELASDPAAALDLEAAAAAAGVQLDARLRERHLGVLQGLTRAEAAQRFPQAYDALSAVHSDPTTEGAPETLECLEARAEEVLEELAARHPGGRVMVVTHGGFLQAAYQRAAGHPNWGRNANASINTIRIDAAGGKEAAQQVQQAQQQQQQQHVFEQQQQAQRGGGREVQQGRQRCAWAVVRWGDADHLAGVGALASAFGGGTEG